MSNNENNLKKHIMGKMRRPSETGSQYISKERECNQGFSARHRPAWVLGTARDGKEHSTAMH
jgi:hypothetical protein